MEVIKLSEPCDLKLLDAKFQNVDFMFGADGYLASIFPDAPIINNTVDLVLSQHEYKYPFRGSDTDLVKAIRTGRYDIIVAPGWHPSLLENTVDVLIPIETDIVAKLSVMYEKSFIVRTPDKIYFHGVHPIKLQPLSKTSITLPIVGGALGGIIDSLLQMFTPKFG